MSENPNSGHRQRLRERFLRAGPEALADYEFLELVLFRAIPRRDVKPLAKALLAQFGGLAAVLRASPDQLRSVPGLGETAITELKIIEAAVTRLLRAEVMGQSVLGSWSALMAYCKASMGERPAEQFRILFLDRKNVLIADEVQSQGTVDHVQVYPREVVKRALHHNASAIILLHNHPSGDPTPSAADIEMTRQIVAACRTVNVAVHDHVIIGRSQDISFRALGLL